jgi:hypothetical protein
MTKNYLRLSEDQVHFCHQYLYPKALTLAALHFLILSDGQYLKKD